MSDLTTLDPTIPQDSDPVSQGASKMREERSDIIGWAGTEHALAGAHKFIFGAPGVRPAAGNAGRIWFDTTNKRIERDTGAAWVMANAVGFGNNFISGSIALTSSMQDVVAVTVDVPTGAALTIFGTFQATVLAGGNVSWQVLSGATQLQPGALTSNFTSTGGLQPCIIIAASGVPPAGSTTLHLQASTTTGSASVASRFIWVLTH